MLESAFATGVWMVCKRILGSSYWKLTDPQAVDVNRRHAHCGANQTAAPNSPETGEAGKHHSQLEAARIGRSQCDSSNVADPSQLCCQEPVAARFLSRMLNSSPRDSLAIGLFYPINTKYEKPSTLIY